MTMHKRECCTHCNYPLKTCVCEHIEQVQSSMQISIIQDRLEAKHAKNTARLIPLLLPQCEIYVGAIPQDFEDLQKKLSNYPNTLLIYPNNNAISLSSGSLSTDGVSVNVPVSNKNILETVKHLILLDGTWRKAKRLYLSNPWLQAIQSVQLSSKNASDYHIRKRSFENSFSTIEALAMTLSALEGISTAPFSKALAALQSHWRGTSQRGSGQLATKRSKNNPS